MGKIIQYFTNSFYDVVIVGENTEKMHEDWLKDFIPNSMLMGGKSSIPLLQEKMNEKIPTIFVCKEKVYQKPVATISEALELMPH
ncbi:MAG: hypothetical protein QNL61_08535 [Crocinitomicaceae bacterium]